MSDFDKLQKIVLDGQEKILSEPNKANFHRFNLFKDLIKTLIDNTNKNDKNKLVHNFDTGEPYYKKIEHKLDSRNRFRVSLAQIKPDLGISFDDMNFIQRLCVMYILQVLLSNDMFYKFLIVMLQQNVLGEFADMKYWAKDKDEIAKVIASYNPKTKKMDEKVLDVKHKDAITKHAYARSQGAYWSYIFMNKDMTKIGYAFSGHHININFNFYKKGNKIEIETMPFFLGSAPTIIPGVLKKDIKKITCKKYDRTLGFWNAMSGMTIGTSWYYFNALINSIKNKEKYRFSLDDTKMIIGEKEIEQTGGHAPPGSSKLDAFVDTCDRECYDKNISALHYNNMSEKTKNVLNYILDYLQSINEFKETFDCTINNIVKDKHSFKLSWSGNLIESKKSKEDPLLYVRLMGKVYTIEYLISSEYTISPSTTKSLYTHEHIIVRYTDSHFPYKRAFDIEKPYYLDKKYTRKARKSNKTKTRRKK
tara:strand:- start:13453 stop:14883 length:1431 start_codon:yes stop_codon:yes gene_type:complete